MTDCDPQVILHNRLKNCRSVHHKLSANMESEKPGPRHFPCGLSTPSSCRRRKSLCKWIQVMLLSLALFLAASLFLSVLAFPVGGLRSLHDSKILILKPVQPLRFFPTYRRSCATNEFGLAASHMPSNDLSRATVPITRIPDTLDTFINYRYRNHTNCRISSLDLHTPFDPLCSTRADVLNAISGGGRIGKEAPFMPRDCDMRWYSTEEVCEIFERFEKVIVIGDSMMRHVVGAMNVLLRKDLGYGAVTNWNFSPKERYVMKPHGS